MGKSKSPDMSGVNAAAQQNAQVAREQLGLAREQWADSKARADEFEPLFQQLIKSSLDQQQTAMDQSADQWQSYQTLFKPAEEKLVNTAMNYDTPERRAQEAQSAGAGVAQQFDLKRQALDRDLGRANVTVGSGKGLALLAGNRMSEAKATASAENTARRQVEQTGISLVDNASRFGRNMPSTGIQTAQQAMQAGSSATGTIGAQQGLINSGVATAGSLLSGASNSSAQAGNLYLGAASAASANNANSMAGLASMGQLAGSMYSMFSSKELKEPLEGGGEAATTGSDQVKPGQRTLGSVNKLNSEGWRYTTESGIPDRDPHYGTYAEDTQRLLGDEVAPGGKVIRVDKMMRVNHDAIEELAEMVRQMSVELDELEAHA